MLHILVIDGEKNIRHHFKAILTGAGFLPYFASSYKEAEQTIQEHTIDLILMDIALPGANGITFIHKIRENDDSIPILVISAHNSHQVINCSFEEGADDYMIKPFNDQELILRIKALCKRSHVNILNILKIGETTLDQTTHTITCRQKKLRIPPKEFDLLFFLLSYPNHVYSREMLLQKIWGPATESEPATVSVHINHLRNRFFDSPDFEIQTVRRCGYKAIIREKE